MLFFIIFLYILGGTLLFAFQRSFIYHPTGNIEHSFITETFSINSASINVLVLNEGKSNAIIYFGGNGESVVYNAPHFIDSFPDHTIYLVNYRGYGGSSGKPSEKTIYSDAQKIYDIVGKRHRQVSTIGRSLGTGVATYLASIRDIDKLILITPYDSIENMAKDIYPIYPVSLILLDKYDSISRINKIKSKTLIILAENDVVIPRRYSNRLINAFPPNQVLVKVIHNAGHNNLSRRNEYYYLLHDFMY